MGTDPQAEFLVQIARHKELIETANKIIEHSTSLVKESRRLVRMAHSGREDNNHKRDSRIPLKPSCEARIMPIVRLKKGNEHPDKELSHAEVKTSQGEFLPQRTQLLAIIAHLRHKASA